MKDKNDKLAFMKGLLDINKYQLTKFIVVRMLLNF